MNLSKEEQTTYNFLLKEIENRPVTERTRALDHLQRFIDTIRPEYNYGLFE